MKRPRTLRTRIVLYFCGYLAILLTLYSGALVGVFRDAEDRAFNRQIREISDRLADYIETHQKIPPYLPMHVSAYIGLPNVPPPLQEAVRARQPGVFEFNEDGFGYHVALVPVNALDQMLYVFYNVTSIKATERFESNMAFALLVIGLGVLMMGWLMARALSNGILNPVSELAESVQSLSLDKDTVRLNAFNTADEVGMLAGTINQLLSRISAFTRREREFTAHASHELRTPVTVIKGAMEIIRHKKDDADTALQRPLERIDRAVMDIEMLIDTFLLLARQNQLPDKDETCSLPAVVDTVTNAYRHLLAAKPVDVRIRTADSGALPAPPSLVTIALGNLVRNAFQYTMRGEVEIEALADRVRINDSGPGFDGTGAGGGLGLTIVRRLCERMGWNFYITSQPDQGTRAELVFLPNDWGRGRQMKVHMHKTKVEPQDGDNADQQA